MKPLLIILCAALTACESPSVLVVSDGSNKAMYKSGWRMGGREGIAGQMGATKFARYSNNEKSFSDIQSTIKTGIISGDLKDVGVTGINATRSVLTARESTKAAEIGANAATEQSRIAAEAAAATTPTP